MLAAAFTRASVGFLFCVAAGAAMPAQAQNYDSAGLLRFGVFAEGAWNTFDVRDPVGFGSVSADGFGGGASLGYDWLFSSGWLIGLESDISAGSWPGSRAGRDFNIDYLATIRGRVGTYLRPDLMIYATGGFALIGTKQRGPFDTTTGERLKTSNTVPSWTVGAGIEYEWGSAIFFGEYLFVSSDDITHNDPTHFNVSVDENILRLGVKFKIGYDFHEGPVW